MAELSAPSWYNAGARPTTAGAIGWILMTSETPANRVCCSLVFALNLLGDSICRLPAIQAVKEAYGGARVIVVADPRYREVFEGQAFIDEVWTLDRRGGRTAQLARWAGLALRARAARPDLVLDLYGSSRTAFVSWLSGGPRRAGRHRAGRSRWYNLRAESPGLAEGGHIIEQVNRVAALAGVTAPAGYAPVAAATADRQAAAAALASLDLPPGARYGLLNPSARVEAKRWPPERFGALARVAGREEGLRWLVITAPGEESLAREVVAASGGAAQPLPAMAIRPLAALMEGAALVVTGDTGVLHLAAAMGAPAVILAGPTDPSLVTLPACRQVAVFHRDACGQWRDGVECPTYNDCRDRRCIEAITVQQVAAAVRRLTAL